MTTTSFCNDHNHCIENALQQAETICHFRKVKLTPLRKRVLALIWQNHKPLGAYDILNTLSMEDGHTAAPPTVYRALEFLLEQGLIHRIASLNAFLGCIHPSKQHLACFFICQHCGNAEELVESQTLQQEIQRRALDLGFSIQQSILEVAGWCKQCEAHRVLP